MSDESRRLGHEEVEAMGLVDRYVRGDLDADFDADLETEFEEHLFGCEACQEELETAGELRDALRDLAAQEAARRVVGAAAAVGFVARLRRWAPWLVAVLVVAPALWLAVRVGDLRTAAEDAEAGAEAARSELESSREAAKRRIAELSERLESAAAGALTEPLSNLPLILLERTRGGNDLPELPSDAAFTLAVDVLEEETRSFDVKVLSGAGDVVLDRPRQRPDVLGMLRITFPAGYFAPGEYRVTVTTAGAVEPLSAYGFEVIEPAEAEPPGRAG